MQSTCCARLCKVLGAAEPITLTGKEVARLPVSQATGTSKKRTKPKKYIYIGSPVSAWKKGECPGCLHSGLNLQPLFLLPCPPEKSVEGKGEDPGCWREGAALCADHNPWLWPCQGKQGQLCAVLFMPSPPGVVPALGSFPFQFP